MGFGLWFLVLGLVSLAFGLRAFGVWLSQESEDRRPKAKDQFNYNALVAIHRRNVGNGSIG